MNLKCSESFDSTLNPLRLEGNAKVLEDSRHKWHARKIPKERLMDAVHRSKTMQFRNHPKFMCRKANLKDTQMLGLHGIAWDCMGLLCPLISSIVNCSTSTASNYINIFFLHCRFSACKPAHQNHDLAINIPQPNSRSNKDLIGAWRLLEPVVLHDLAMSVQNDYHFVLL